MKNKWWIIGLIAVALAVLSVCCGCLLITLAGLGGTSTTSIGPADAVAVIRIEGVLAGSPQGGLLTGVTTSPESIIGQIREANKDSRVAGILLRIDSPGGSAATSQEIYQEVKRSKKPVVASVADIGASGAYYIASAADEIWASPASQVGSIGVIIELANLEGLYEKLGIDYVIIKQGKYKDIGSPDRPMTEEERRLLTEMTQTIYDQFIKDVAAGRGMPEDKVRELATGMVWAGSTAKDLGLVDRLGNYQDAVERAGKLGKISGEPQIVEYGGQSLLDLLTGPLSESRLGVGDVLDALNSKRLPR